MAGWIRLSLPGSSSLTSFYTLNSFFLIFKENDKSRKLKLITIKKRTLKNGGLDPDIITLGYI